MQGFEMNERFREIRKALKVTQEAFGKPIGLSRSEVKNIEYDLTIVKEKIISPLCIAYNVNESWLRTGEGEMFLPTNSYVEAGKLIAEAMQYDDQETLDFFVDIFKHMDPVTIKLLRAAITREFGNKKD